MSDLDRRGLVAVVLAVVSIACGAPERPASTEPASDASAVPGAEPDGLRLELPGFFPEGITHDPVTGRFFLGSLRQNRIVQVTADGSVSDFVAPCQGGLLGVVGIRVDPERRELWACSAYDPKGPECAGEVRQTGLFKFSLEDGRLLGRWLVEQPGEKYLFNDVVISKGGDAYATTFAGGEIHKVHAATGEMSLLVKMEGEAWNNGIALSSDERYLLISADEGIYRMDLESRAIVEIVPPAGEQLGHADGLYYLDGSLLAVQGYRVDGEPTRRIARSWLSDDYSAVTSIDVLAQDDPAWIVPTTGVIVGQHFHLLATSYLDRIDKPGPDGGPATHPPLVLVQRLPLTAAGAGAGSR